MEAVLKNLESTAELLALSQTDIVLKWDKQTLDRAFQWAQYCEQLYTRFHANPTVRDILEKQLQATNERLQVTFPGYTGIFFPDLLQFQHLLLVGLLKNASVPSSVIKLLFDTSSSTVGETFKDTVGYCTELIVVKSACKVLSGLNAKRAVSFPSPDAEVMGTALMDILETILSPATGRPKVDLAETFLDSILQTCGENKNVSVILAAALLAKKHNSHKTTALPTTKTASTTTSGADPEDFLLDWLQQQQPDLLRNMLSTMPRRLLKDLSQHSVKFRLAYHNMLKWWGSQLEYDPSTGEWLQICASDGLSFKDLADRYRLVLGACPLMKEEVERELRALMAADGDFDVRGLSVWTDLHAELHGAL
ncbi:Fanconi anemia group F protein [Esox lucius]|uniref:Fanconi anemia group F protein n=1 Tax=Esox lucius TaxID=8010 RepID=C1BXP4_ESOLU|nr:Fanconi anemia group F protein [Esox lucius]ACO13797.1 Fanconi anemia group F protein [Esox lucius]